MTHSSRLAAPAIRRIRPQDAEAWRDVRLRALQDAPDAFGSTYAETVERPPEHWTERAARCAAGDDEVLFLASDGVHEVGLIGGFRSSEAPDSRQLISMWVAPEVRGTRVAERLVNQMLDWAALSDVAEVRLDVTATNGRAIRFYERFGFTPTGNTQPLPSNPSLAEVEMALDIRGRAAIARIEPDEAEAWRATRLAALCDAPDAFGPTYEESAQRPLAHWTDRIEDAARSDHLAVFKAVTRTGEWAAIVGAGSTWSTESDDAGTRHIGSIWIDPGFRGQQLLPRLLDAILDWAIPTGARRLALDVTETNERAIALYERYGFAATGNRHPLRPGSDLDEIEMTMNLYRSEE